MPRMVATSVITVAIPKMAMKPPFGSDVSNPCGCSEWSSNTSLWSPCSIYLLDSQSFTQLLKILEFQALLEPRITQRQQCMMLQLDPEDQRENASNRERARQIQPVERHAFRVV